MLGYKSFKKLAVLCLLPTFSFGKIEYNPFTRFICSSVLKWKNLLQNEQVLSYESRPPLIKFWISTALSVQTKEVYSLFTHCLYKTWGWSGDAMVLGKLPVPRHPTIWIIVGQGPIVLAVGAGAGCLDIFSLIYHFSFLSNSLGDGPI